MQYIIQGGSPLSGEIAVSGAKNVALKLIIAALLTEGETILENIPRIRDVESLIEIINYLGGEAEFIDQNSLRIVNKLKSTQVPLELSAKTRVSFMLIVPLLFALGKAKIPNPGGCRLGARPVDRLVMSLQSFGVAINYNPDDGYYYADLNQSGPNTITFPKKSHTGTELALMFAAKIAGQSQINNAALEPEVDDLIRYLNKAGANIERRGENIIVEGNPQLAGQRFKIQADRNEAVSYIILSALFAGKILVKNINLAALKTFLTRFKAAGFDYQYDEQKSLLQIIPPLKIKPVNIQTAPHPGFMTDWQPIWALLMTQAEGKSQIHETVFENRFGYVAELKKLGVRIDFFQPSVADPNNLYQFNLPDELSNLKQAIEISGPTKLHNGVVKISDLRAGMCLFLSTLLSKGKSVLEGAEQIERGYERLVDKFTALGAKIKIDPNG